MKSIIVTCIAISAFIYSCTGGTNDCDVPSNDTITVIAVDSMHGVKDTTKADTLVK